MKRAVRILMTGLLISCFVCTAGFGQAVSTAQISGTVKDQSGALLPGVDVSATQTDTGLNRMVLTDETGSYVLPNLPAGPYKLEVSLPGFRTYVQTGIVLQVNVNPAIHVVLQVGQVSETIEVKADAAMVETRSSGVGQVINSQEVLELPLNGRQVTQLIFLLGTAVTAPTADLNSAKNYPGPVLVSVGGGPSTGMTYSLDGGTHNDPFNNLNLPLPFPDAIQEFKVETSALQAQYGHHAAAAVNAITKSGTNDLHGDAFEFVRNYLFNARNSFASQRDSLKRNQFGGTVGGPIIANKLFFFGGYQGHIIRSNPGTTVANIPTPAMLQGDFTAIASPACNGNRQITLKPPFIDNHIDPSLLNSAAVKMASYYPTPLDTRCGQITYGSLANSNESMYLYKIDYQRSSNHSLLFRHFIADYYQPTGFNSDNLLTINGTAGADDMVNSAVFGDTRIFGPDIVNSFRATVNRVGITKFQKPFFTPADLGIKITPLIPNHTRITAGTFATSTVYPGRLPTTSYQFSDDISFIRGRHQTGFGVSYLVAHQNVYNLLNSSGSFNFNGQATGLTIADLFAGKPATYTQQNINQDHVRSRYVGLYGQDSWRLTQRVTLSAGLRWEPFFGVRKLRNEVVHFDQKAFDAGIRSKVYVNAPAGLQFPGDPGFDTGGKTNFNTLNNFAPRLGLVWDPKGDGHTTVRAAWGMFYDLPHTLFFFAYAAAPPWGNAVSLTSPAGGLLDPWKDYPGGNPFPSHFASDFKFPTQGVYATNPLNLKNTYLEQWNLSIQKQLASNWLLSANYLGNNTIHLWGNTDINAAQFLPGASCIINGATQTPCSSTANTAQRRRLSLQNPQEGQYYAGLPQLDDGGTGSYNALLLSVQRRFSKALTLSSNYTWAHCISDLVTSEFRNSQYQNPSNRKLDRSNCPGTDRRRVFNLSAVASSPSFVNPMLSRLAGDWRFSTIFRLQSGPYLSVTSGIDNALNGLGGQRVDQLVANPIADAPTQQQYFKTGAFAQPSAGSFGNMGASIIEGRGSFGFDVALSRVFPIREQQRMEFRAEGFDVLNKLKLDQPNTAFNATSFGTTTSGTGERIMQFALKYYF